MPKRMNLWQWAQLGFPGAFMNELLVVVHTQRGELELTHFLLGPENPRTITAQNVWEVGRLFRCRAADIQGWMEVDPNSSIQPGKRGQV